MLPRFFVIGAYRSGTTSLYRSLRQHPGVFLPLEKEPNFFAVDGDPDVSDVLLERSVTTRDAYEALYAACRPDQVPGDISPEYLTNPWASRRIAELVPEARLVAVVRNPVDRAWSDYLLHRRDGNEPCETLAEALDQQAERQRHAHRAGNYLESGRYAPQLRRYLDRFDADQLQVHLYDDLRADPAATYRAIFTHIGVDPDVEVQSEAEVNASGIPTNRAVALMLSTRARLRPLANRNRELLERVRPAWERLLSRHLTRPELGADDRALLVDVFRDEVADLGDLLDRDLSHWLEAR